MFKFLQWLLCHDATNGLGQVRQRDPYLRFVKKNYMTGFWGQKFYTPKVHELNFWKDV